LYLNFGPSYLGVTRAQASVDILTERRRIWRSKKILGRLYHTWYGLIADALRPGNTLELGGGSGNLKEFFPDTISSDILFAPWLDAVLDAHVLPFKNESLHNIVLFDVIHHLMEPAHFFSEAERVLTKKGRIIAMEPYISWASFFVYKFLHTEGMVWHINPFKRGYLERKKNPFQGNQAIPTLIFKKYREQFIKNFPRLDIIGEERMDFVIYPLSGGFHNPSLCPLFLYPVLECLEKSLRPLNRFVAFRLFVVIEKN
jgi:SAM-dependent methyltransferase